MSPPSDFHQAFADWFHGDPLDAMLPGAVEAPPCSPRYRRLLQAARSLAEGDDWPVAREDIAIACYRARCLQRQRAYRATLPESGFATCGPDLHRPSATWLEAWHEYPSAMTLLPLVDEARGRGALSSVWARWGWSGAAESDNEVDDPSSHATRIAARFEPSLLRNGGVLVATFTEPLAADASSSEYAQLQGFTRSLDRVRQSGTSFALALRLALRELAEASPAEAMSPVGPYDGFANAFATGSWDVAGSDEPRWLPAGGQEIKARLFERLSRWRAVAELAPVKMSRVDVARADDPLLAPTLPVPAPWQPLALLLDLARRQRPDFGQVFNGWIEAARGQPIECADADYHHWRDLLFQMAAELRQAPLSKPQWAQVSAAFAAEDPELGAAVVPREELP